MYIDFTCFSSTFGDAPEGFTASVLCDGDYVGVMTAKCVNSTYVDVQNNCILSRIKDLLDQSLVSQFPNHIFLPYNNLK